MKLLISESLLQFPRVTNRSDADFLSIKMTDTHNVDFWVPVILYLLNQG